MKQYHFDQIIDRSDTFSLKWENTSGRLPLWVADMDLPVAQPILDALKKRAEHPIFGYSVYENKRLKSAITGWFSRRFNWNVAPEKIFFCPGIVPALCYLIQMLTLEGDGIVIQPPVYHPFAGKIHENGRRVVENPLVCETNGYRIDFADLEQKLMPPDVKGLLLCSPHNPVGRVWTPEELKKTVDICRKLDKWIISDEIHCDILRAGVTHHPLLKLCPEEQDRIILCNAPTKTFNLAGVQLSNIIIHSAIYQERWKTLVGRLGMLDANPFAIAATIAAYTDGEEWLSQANAYIDGNLKFAVSYLEEHLPKVRVYLPQGTYLLWVDFREYASDKQLLEECMYEKAKVLLNQGYIFGMQGEGFERINVACPQALLEKALEQICYAIRSL